ncbi:hypothetical protein H920_11322 [Fukomys damarensis]|uniref:Uncharacterized protein n=1 Tax=Fukomys damarensis TaxID=885580 RepID=A0A091D5B7_FUKDA|nr:hypothetical protein H920_11322 [Fukomys damarensis]
MTYNRRKRPRSAGNGKVASPGECLHSSGSRYFVAEELASPGTWMTPVCGGTEQVMLGAPSDEFKRRERMNLSA